jgi:lysophospholipase L1-like esterase
LNETPPTSPHPRRWRRAGRAALCTTAALIFLASVVLNVILFRQSNGYYREMNQVRLDPYGLKLPGFQEPPNADVAKPLVVFFGDSRAQQWPAPPVSRFRFLNRGIGGQTSEQVRGRFAEHVRPLKPQVVIVEAGINDLKAVALFPWRRDQIVADCKANLKEIIRQATDGGATVIVTTIFPAGPVPLDRRLQWSPQIERAVEEVNADLRSLQAPRVLVFDAWYVLQRDGRMPAEYSVETVHVNAQGYTKLNSELAKLLESITAR